jgi:4-hydroxythreonine-4-phosphate dehydrogenase
MDGFCFAPLNKAALKAGGYDHPSEHEMYAHIYGQKENFGEMNYLHGLWNIRVTSHIPFKDICRDITVENILKTARLGFATLRRAGCANPKIAVAALNPHSGENGTCGREELDIIIPAIELAAKEGMPLDGPISADILFLKALNKENKYDGALTMYHDQGQIAIKLQDFKHCVTISAGLPHPITTPAHGTAYDIAGTGKCVTLPFEDAFNLCCSMAKSDLIKKNT